MDTALAKCAYRIERSTGASPLPSGSVHIPTLTAITAASTSISTICLREPPRRHSKIAPAIRAIPVRTIRDSAVDKT